MIGPPKQPRPIMWRAGARVGARRGHAVPVTKAPATPSRFSSLGVLATVSPSGAPEAALMDVAVSDSAELIFDTRVGTRKLTNIDHNDRVAVVIGWDFPGRGKSPRRDQ
jgi:Pyridoxamine 5'-phosphate oxidase